MAGDVQAHQQKLNFLQGYSPGNPGRRPYPPGTSKWNKVEHRLFSFVSLNWVGQPLVSYQTGLSLIRATKTQTGLRVRAKRDRHYYATGEMMTEEQMDRLNLLEHKKFPIGIMLFYPLQSPPPLQYKLNIFCGPPLMAVT